MYHFRQYDLPPSPEGVLLLSCSTFVYLRELILLIPFLITHLAAFNYRAR